MPQGWAEICFLTWKSSHCTPSLDSAYDSVERFIRIDAIVALAKELGVSREKTESLYNDGLIRVSRVTHARIGDRDLNCPELSRIVTCWVLITRVSG